MRERQGLLIADPPPHIRSRTSIAVTSTACALSCSSIQSLALRFHLHLIHSLYCYCNRCHQQLSPLTKKRGVKAVQARLRAKLCLGLTTRVSTVRPAHLLAVTESARSLSTVLPSEFNMMIPIGVSGSFRGYSEAPASTAQRCWRHCVAILGKRIVSMPTLVAIKRGQIATASGQRVLVGQVATDNDTFFTGRPCYRTASKVTHRPRLHPPQDSCHLDVQPFASAPRNVDKSCLNHGPVPIR